MRLVFLLVVLFALCPAFVRADGPTPDDLVVVGEGMAAINEDDVGAAEEEAIWDAKRNAVEQACGVFLRARSSGRDFELNEDEIRSSTSGYVREWAVVPGSRTLDRLGGGRVLRLKVRAVVGLIPVIRRLADMTDVYADLERPRIRLEVRGAGPVSAAENGLVAALKEQGFEVASGGPAEVVLMARLEIIPTVHLGDRDSPYGVGESVAACRARLSVQVLSTASEEVLLNAQSEGEGRTFRSDAEASVQAAADAAGALFTQNEKLFAQHLLARWARERQEGHLVAVRATGLDSHHRALLKERVRAMRGFLKMVSETGDKSWIELRFRTRLDTRAVRRRLSSDRLESASLAVLNDRGPIILCAVVPSATRVSHQ